MIGHSKLLSLKSKKEKNEEAKWTESKWLTYMTSSSGPIYALWESQEEKGAKILFKK